jgi:hypothetical protein
MQFYEQKGDFAMTKKKKFTVGYISSNYKGETDPYIKFGGNWLRDFGIEVGDKLELIQGKNMLVLMKVPKAD